MSTAIQRRRGTTAEHSTFTGLVGEISVDTTKKTAVVHDGSTPGGNPLATEANLTSGLAAKAALAGSTSQAFSTAALTATGITTVASGGSGGVFGSSNTSYAVVQGSTTANSGAIYFNGAGRVGLESELHYAATKHKFYNETVGTLLATLNNTGNFMLGTTAPAAWKSTSKAIQLGTSSFIENNSGVATYVGFNAYRDSGGGWVYLTNEYATRYGAEAGGNHSWATAPTGTAGNAVTFTQRMLLTVAGTLSTLCESTGRSLEVNNTSVNGAAIVLSNAGNDFAAIGSNKWATTGNLNDLFIGTQAAGGDVVIGTQSVGRVTVSSAGLTVTGVGTNNKTSGATNNTSPTATVVKNTTTGAAASGFGVTLALNTADSGGTYNAGEIQSRTTGDPFNSTIYIRPYDYGSTDALAISSGGITALGFITAGTRVNHKSYTVGTLPAAGVAGGEIYVSDAAVAPCLAFSNGTNWKRCDNAATTVI